MADALSSVVEKLIRSGQCPIHEEGNAGECYVCRRAMAWRLHPEWREKPDQERSVDG